MSEQDGRQATTLQHPTTNDPGGWKAYWEVKGQEWRTEPEIGLERRKELAHCLILIPDIDKGMYPLKGVKLSRADVEWLLAGCSNRQEPVDKEDENRLGRRGIDLRGAHLQYLDLKGLPLAGVCGGLQRHEWVKASAEQCEAAAVHLERADLRFTNLEKANLHYAHLERADLRSAYVEQVDLTKAHLQEADLNGTHFEGADLSDAHLESAYLSNAHFEQAQLLGAHLEGAFLSETHFEGTNLREVFFTTETQLINISLGDERFGFALLADVRRGDTNLAVVNWGVVKKLGDEREAERRKRDDEPNQLLWYRRATRANRQLSVVLRDQGLNEEADHFAYRARLLQRTVWRIQGRPLKFLLSWFLYMLAGYGYRPLRSLLWYLIIILGFALAYYALGHLSLFPP